jgi:transcriptional regulator with XRE-family HTH domain
MTSAATLSQIRSTSAAGAMKRRLPSPFLVGLICVGLGTSTENAEASQLAPFEYRVGDGTTSGRAVSAGKPVGSEIGELRRLSGLTWEQLAGLFRVSRRALHLWASGKPMASGNEEHLRRTLAVLRSIDRGSAEANRALLLSEHRTGGLLLDLLAAGRYDHVSVGLRSDDARRTVVTRPSEEVRGARTPRPPEELVGALQDRIHRDIGRSRAAKSVRVRIDR